MKSVSMMELKKKMNEIKFCPGCGSETKSLYNNELPFFRCDKCKAVFTIRFMPVLTNSFLDNSKAEFYREQMKKTCQQRGVK